MYNRKIPYFWEFFPKWGGGVNPIPNTFVYVLLNLQGVFLNWISYCSSYFVSLVVSLGNKNYSFMFFSLFVKIFKLKLKSVMQVLDITLLGLRPRVGIKL